MFYNILKNINLFVKKIIYNKKNTMEKKCCKLELSDAIESFLNTHEIENDRSDIEEWVNDYIENMVNLEVEITDHPYL